LPLPARSGDHLAHGQRIAPRVPGEAEGRVISAGKSANGSKVGTPTRRAAHYRASVSLYVERRFRFNA
jgi:hypothetical protein